MLRVFADFNSRTSDDWCWLLRYNDQELAGQIQKLGLSQGSKIVLYQDEGDFEVIATLDYRAVAEFDREMWIARPDWSTIRR